jgi:hypothetical protein
MTVVTACKAEPELQTLFLPVVRSTDQEKEVL